MLVEGVGEVGESGGVGATSSLGAKETFLVGGEEGKGGERVISEVLGPEGKVGRGGERAPVSAVGVLGLKERGS